MGTRQIRLHAPHLGRHHHHRRRLHHPVAGGDIYRIHAHISLRHLHRIIDVIHAGHHRRSQHLVHSLSRTCHVHQQRRFSGWRRNHDSANIRWRLKPRLADNLLDHRCRPDRLHCATGFPIPAIARKHGVEPRWWRFPVSHAAPTSQKQKSPEPVISGRASRRCSNVRFKRERRRRFHHQAGVENPVVLDIGVGDHIANVGPRNHLPPLHTHPRMARRNTTDIRKPRRPYFPIRSTRNLVHGIHQRPRWATTSTHNPLQRVRRQLAVSSRS